MNNKQLQAIIEGLLFVSGDDGIGLVEISGVLDNEKPSTIKKIIEELDQKYQKDEASVFSIQKFNANKYRLQTKTEYETYLAKLKTIEQPHKLTPSAIEVLSIVAYEGPITRSQIDAIRNSDSSYQVQRLKEKKLIHSIGRHESTNANLYEITDNFYKVFNLKNGRGDLPKIDQDNSDLDNDDNLVTDNKNRSIFKEDFDE